MFVYENRAAKMKFFWCLGIFDMNFDTKNGHKNEFKDNNENHAADPEIVFLRKSISRPQGRATAMPPMWGLIIPKKMTLWEIMKICSQFSETISRKIDFTVLAETDR